MTYTSSNRKDILEGKILSLLLLSFELKFYYWNNINNELSTRITPDDSNFEYRTYVPKKGATNIKGIN